jgi:hypothetical protein
MPFPSLLPGLILGAALLAACHGEARRSVHELQISGDRFLLDGAPFEFTGVSFFNALFNAEFNRDSATRRAWLQKFAAHGINVLRVWCQWDNKRGFVDAAPGSTLFEQDGSLRREAVTRLSALLDDADVKGFVIELCLFARESKTGKGQLSRDARRKGARLAAQALRPWRNMTIQIWNECDEDAMELLRIIREADPRRLVTNSPGFAGDLGRDAENAALDYLTPHTSRQGGEPHWEKAPREIESLLRKFKKPVVDDEPARNGTASFGGPKGGTSPGDHITQIKNVRALGAYVIYHHDMFQTGAGSPAVPPSGIPDPSFSPYHAQVFDFLGKEASALKHPPKSP